MSELLTAECEQFRVVTRGEGGSRDSSGHFQRFHILHRLKESAIEKRREETRFRGEHMDLAVFPQHGHVFPVRGETEIAQVLLRHH